MSDHDRPDAVLICAAREGSEPALEALFHRYWSSALRAAFLVCQDRAGAEDVAQEAFLSAVRSLDRFDRRRPFGPWLHRITVNRAIDWTRRRSVRAETAMASAELTVERAKNLADLTEKQLRVAMHAPEGEAMAPGENLESAVPAMQGNLRQMTIEALSSRPEVKSADANAASARLQADAAKASRYPVLSAFADGIVGNPNPRYIPPTNVWNSTWDVGAQITWSPNDVLTANGNVRDIESRVAVIEANKNVTRDNIEIEVTQMLQQVHEADFSIESSTRELASAQEAYRVQRELFNNGRGTSATLADAESDLTRARLDLLNSKVSARTARIRLEHALGRDAKPVQ